MGVGQPIEEAGLFVGGQRGQHVTVDERLFGPAPQQIAEELQVAAEFAAAMADHQMAPQGQALGARLRPFETVGDQSRRLVTGQRQDHLDVVQHAHHRLMWTAP